MYFLINRGISLITLLPMGGGVRGSWWWGFFPLPLRGGKGWGFLFSPYLQPHRVLYIRLTDQLQVAFTERTDPYILSCAD